VRNVSISCGLIVLLATTATRATGPEDAVVKVTSTRRFPNVMRPWTKLDTHEEYVTFRFAEDHVETLVFRRRDLEAATAEVMADNRIPRRGTPEVMAIWESKPSTSR
jgi:hypothetical protein